VGKPGGVASSEEISAGRNRVRRVTLQQVKQQSANRVTSPASRLSQLSVEAAKQHRLAVQADYFPKFGDTFVNLHYTEFLGQLITVRRALASSPVQVPVPIFSQNQTIAMLTFTQPITPLLEVRQAFALLAQMNALPRRKPQCQLPGTPERERSRGNLFQTSDCSAPVGMR
jgi:hypothetical protein